MRLRNYTECIPGQFYFVHPETEVVFGPYHSVKDLHKAVTDHDNANGFPPTNLSDIEDQNCRRHPEFCRPDPLSHLDPTTGGQAGNLPSSSGVTGRDIIKATKRLARWIVGGRKKVEKATIQNRAKTCQSCPEHVGYEGCSGCTMNALRAVVNLVVGQSAEPEAKKLKVCRVCGCALEAKVQIPADFFASETDRLPDHCWIKKELAQESHTE